MSRDNGLLGGDEVDAFELGDCDENGVKRSGGRNDSSGTSDMGIGAPRHRYGPLSAHLKTMEERA